MRDYARPRRGMDVRNVESIEELLKDMALPGRADCYTWKGGSLEWNAHWQEAEDPATGERKAEVWKIEKRHYQSSYVERLAFKTTKHPESGQWLTVTPSGYALHSGPEDGLDIMEAAWTGVPEPRTLEITLRNVKVEEGVTDSQVIDNVRRAIEGYGLFRNRSYAASNVTITETPVKGKK